MVYLLNMVIFHGYVSHNQMVKLHKICSVPGFFESPRSQPHLAKQVTRCCDSIFKCPGFHWFPHPKLGHWRKGRKPNLANKNGPIKVNAQFLSQCNILRKWPIWRWFTDETGPFSMAMFDHQRIRLVGDFESSPIRIYLDDLGCRCQLVHKWFIAHRCIIYTYTHIHIYIYTHIHIYTYTDTYIHIYTYTHIHIYRYIYTYIHIYRYTYTHIHIYIYTHIHIYTYTDTYIHIYTYTHIHIYRYIYTYIHIYRYTYTHIHIYTYTHIQIYIHIYSWGYFTYNRGIIWLSSHLRFLGCTLILLIVEYVWDSQRAACSISMYLLNPSEKTVVDGSVSAVQKSG